jgi:hypothetical protein
MLLDSLMSEFDTTWIEHRVLNGRPADVHKLAIHIDFLDAMRCGPVVRRLFTLRAAAEGMAVAARRSQVVNPSEPRVQRVGELPEHGDLVRLGEDPLNESRERTRSLAGDGQKGQVAMVTGSTRAIGRTLLASWARLARPDDVARAVNFHLADTCALITAQLRALNVGGEI